MTQSEGSSVRLPIFAALPEIIAIPHTHVHEDGCDGKTASFPLRPLIRHREVKRDVCTVAALEGVECRFLVHSLQLYCGSHVDPPCTIRTYHRCEAITFTPIVVFVKRVAWERAVSRTRSRVPWRYMHQGGLRTDPQLYCSIHPHRYQEW